MSLTTSETADREIVTTRIFDAPRELVFAAWTDPQHVARWFGPTGFTVTTREMDVRPGGTWRFVMHGPDGTDYDNVITWIEVARPERLAYMHGDEKDPDQFRTTVTFEDLDGKTRLTMRALLPTAAAREFVVRERNAIEGAQQTIERLGQWVAERRRLVLTREFDAPRDLVWKAWTDPKHLARWWGPHGFSNPVAEVEARPGGAILIHMRGPDGGTYPMDGVFHEVSAPERLVFVSRALMGETPLLEVLNIVTFADLGGRTRLTVDATVVKARPEAEGALAGMREGWTQSLERLDALATGDLLLSRVFAAPRDLVWKAWTDPDRLRRWWGPKGFEWAGARMDLRPGGLFHYHLRSPAGQEMWGKFVYREIVPPEKLSFRVSFSDEHGATLRAPFSATWPLEVLNTLTLHAHGGYTMVVLRGTPHDATAEERRTFAEAHAQLEAGFAGTLDQLERHLAGA